MTVYFHDIPATNYLGPSATTDFAYRHYDPERVV